MANYDFAITEYLGAFRWNGVTYGRWRAAVSGALLKALRGSTPPGALPLPDFFDCCRHGGAGIPLIGNDPGQIDTIHDDDMLECHLLDTSDAADPSVILASWRAALTAPPP